MRRAPHLAATVATLLVAAPAAADTFGGFSSVNRSYLVNQDKVCAPLAIEAAKAAGPPRCEKVAADRLASLSFKPANLERGPKATFSATAAGNELVVVRVAGGEVVRWQSLDPIAKVIDVYADHEERVAVLYQVRRLGRDVTDVVAFELRGKSAPPPAGKDPAGKDPAGKDPKAPVVDPVSAAPSPDPAVTKAVEAARKAKGKAAASSWRRVLTLDALHSEALYRAAAAALAAKDRAGALATLDKLAASPRPDASEWRVAARFDAAFTSLRADAAFRRAVGLDRPAADPYEKVMGQGGVWEQSGTACDSPTVAMTFTRDKKFRLNVKSTCEGMVSNAKFAGTWRIEGPGVSLIMPNRDANADIVRCLFEAAGDEEALRCPLDEDLQLRVLPARR